MSYNLSANCYIGVRSFSGLLEILDLPIPQAESGFYFSPATDVKKWMDKYNNLMNSSMEGAKLSHIEILFCQCMFIVVQNINDYRFSVDSPQDSPFIPNGYRACFY